VGDLFVLGGIVLVLTGTIASDRPVWSMNTGPVGMRIL
jgi:hypothetical protein